MVRQELLLVALTVVVMGENVSLRTACGFVATLVGVVTYKVVTSGQRAGTADSKLDLTRERPYRVFSFGE